MLPLAALEETHETVEQLSQLLSELAPHITHKPALAPLARALIDFLHAIPNERGEGLMQHEEVMLRAIARAQREAEEADALAEGDDAPPPEQRGAAIEISTPRGVPR